MNQRPSFHSQLFCCAALLLCSWLSPRLGTAQVPEDEIRAVAATQAMLHDWRANRTRENRLKVAEIALAYHLREQGHGSEVITERVQDFRDSVSGPTPTDFDSALRTALGAGGGAGGMYYITNMLPLNPALSIALRAGGGVIAAYGLNAWFEGNDDVSIFGSLNGSFDDVIKNYVERYRSDSEFRSVADEVIVPRWGFRPTDDIDTILRSAPDFADHIAVTELLDDVTALRVSNSQQEELQRTIERELERVQNDVQTAAQSLRTFVGDARERWANEAARRSAALTRQRDALDTANAQATVGLAATLIGFSDPDLGRGLSVIGDATFGVHAGLRAYEYAVEINANMGLASAALTGNLLATAVNLAGFFSGGPQPEQILLNQMRELSAQIDQVRTEMHRRFDYVDERLDGILNSVLGGFREVAVDLRRIQSDLTTANRQLNLLVTGQRALEDLVVEVADDLRAIIMDLIITMNGCGPDSPFRLDEETLDRRLECLGAFGSMARSLEFLQVGAGSIGAGDQWTDFHFQELLRLAQGRAGAQRSVVGPEAWFAVTSLLEQYLSKRPDFVLTHSARVEVFTGPELRRRRTDLLGYMEIVRDELNAFRAGQDSVFSALLNEARGHVANLEAAVRGSVDRYYLEEHEAGRLRVVVDDDGRPRMDEEGRVMPEVRFEEDMPTWRPLREVHQQALPPVFSNITRAGEEYPEELRNAYRGGDVPAWLTLENGCENYFDLRSLGQMDDERLQALVLDLLHEDEMMPARLGMGEIGVCTSRDLGLGESGGWGVGRRYWTRFIDVEYSFKYCEDEFSRLVTLPYLQTWRDTPISGEEYIQIRELMAYTRAERAEAGRNRRLTNACWNEYLDVVEGKRRVMMEWVRQDLAGNEEIGVASQRMKALGAALRSWLGVAFGGVVGESEALRGIVRGSVGVPDLEEMLEDGGVEPWAVSQNARWRIERVDQLLRSSAFGSVVAYGVGHGSLTETEWESLGDADHGAQ